MHTNSLEGYVSTISAHKEAPVVDRARLDWVSAQLSRYNYKPGSFGIDTKNSAQPVVNLRFATEDSTNPGAPFIGESDWSISDLPTNEKAFGFWLLAAVTSAKMHEVAERVMFDGQLVADPHSLAYRVWSLGLYHEILQEAKANGNPYLYVLHAATATAVRRGTVPPEVPAQTGCIDHLQRNIQRRLAEPLHVTIEQDRLDWVSAQLRRCSYKNWTFEVDIEGFAQPVAIMRFATEDSTNPGAPFIGESAYNISDLPTDPEAFKFWLLAAVTSAEMHEVAESVRVDGQQVAAPHSEKFRVWSLGLYDEICQEAKANGNPYLYVLHAATVNAVRRGTVPLELPAQTGYTSHLQRRLVKPMREMVVA